MGLARADRVKETSTTTGTGTYTLLGAPSADLQTFSAAIGNTNTCWYCAFEPGVGWEVGLGTVGAGTLARTTILKSSNANAAVNWSAGTRQIFNGIPADKFLDPAYFRVDKGGTAQTIPDNTNTKVTWSNEVYDNGGYFASDKWTPPAGTYVLHAQAFTFGLNLAAGATAILYIYKNGAALLQTAALDPILSGLLAMALTAVVEANGTDYFEVYIYYDTTAGDGSLAGNAVYTFFEGWQIK